MSDTIDIMYQLSDKIVNGELGKEFVFNMHEEKFYVYMDGYWERIENIEMMGMMLKHFNGHIIDENTKAVNITRYTVTRRKQIFENLQPLIYKKLEEFNALGYLNFDVGEYDPVKDFWHPHKKEHYSTLRFGYEYDSKATCDLWIKTLNEIFENDKEKINILQEFFGYCLTRETKQRKALLLIGASNCGKSTILWTLRNMLGDKNCSAVSMKNICNPQYTANLMNKLVNIDTDVAQDAKEYEESFKKIAGGEAINCNSKYIPPFDFFPYSRVIMGSNGFPRVADHSEAFFNRLIIVPCDRVFDEEEQNKDLPELLKAELSGIFNWSCEGLRRLNKRGRFEIKDFAKEARQELRDESNPIDVFFRETIQEDKDNTEPIERGDLYDKYSVWCKNGGNAPMSKIKFGKAVWQKYNRITEKHSQHFATGKLIWRNLKYKSIDKGWDEE